MMADAENRANWTTPEIHHWMEADWRRFITPDDAPDLHYWEPGSELVASHDRSHLRPWPTRMVQRVIHACGLPLLDRTRQSYPAEARPRSIPEEVSERLRELVTEPHS